MSSSISGTSGSTLAGNTSALGNLSVGGTLLVDSNATVDGNLVVTGTVTATDAPRVFRVYPSSTQTITNSWVKLPFNTVDFDTAGNSWSVANTRFIPQKAGYYQIYSQVAIIGSGTNTGAGVIGSLGIYKNGVLNSRGINYYVGSGLTAFDYFTLYANNIVYMNGTTDYIEMYWIRILGSDNIAYTAASESTYMTAAYIR